MQPSGRSRGRARTSSAATPQPVGAVAAGVGAGAGPTTQIGVPSTPLTTAITTTTAQAAPVIMTPTAMVTPMGATIATTTIAPTPVPRPPSPSRPSIPPAESGRGRGFAPPPTTGPATSSTMTTTASSSSSSVVTVSGVTVSTAQGSSAVSPQGGSPKSDSPPSDSPPQQHSPPGAASAGRAALRGQVTVHPTPSSRSELLEPMERLALQQTGGVAAAARPASEYRIESVIHTRPAGCLSTKGTSGAPVTILCNYYEVLNAPNWVLYQYHVDFSPPIDSKRMRLALFHEHNALFPQNKAFDGATLYSTTKLYDDPMEVASKRSTDDQIITITMKRVAEIGPTSPQFVHLFNIVFRRCLRLYGMKEIDRNYYDMKNQIPIPEYGLNLINGFSTAIATYETKLLLCAELTHKLLHNTTILDLMRRIYNESAQQLGRFRDKCTQELVGRIVMTKYNDKTYKIDDIDWNSNPLSEFERREGRISFVEYYKTNYKIEIKDMQQPLLISLPSARDKRRGQTAPSLFVPELCVVTGVDEAMRTDFRFKKALDQFCKVSPAERCTRLNRFVQTFSDTPDVGAELGKWDIRFDRQPVTIQARSLPLETLEFGKGVKKQLNWKADWTNEMRDCSLLGPVALTRWILIYPAQKRNVANDFLAIYGRIIGSLNIRADRPKEVEVPRDDPEMLVSALKQHIDDTVQMVVVLVTSKRKDRYDAIKRICCLERPVPSQVMTVQVIDNEKKKMSVITKIAIQMNCKLGGEVWMSNIPIKNVMLCGIDTYHDSARKNASVCAFIATTNENKTKYFSRATIQETHQELSNNLTITVKSACEYYMKVNGMYPDKVIIYRDGVSDGQLKLVLDYEIPQIEKAFSMLDTNYKPTITFIVVKKRCNARFFAQTGQGLSNPPYGSVIDSVVTRPEWFDFYLISQTATQGTVNPTHYNVIYDTLNYKADHYQKLSFKLTHMYYNWSGTIRVPSLCQYAHKLAFLVGQSLHKEHHASLCDKLFYL